MENRERFENIVKWEIRREGIDDLMEWIRGSDFYDAPASSKFHNNHEGGLCEHSMNVYEELKEMSGGMGINTESIAIVSLFHDICKVNFYKKSYRNVKENGEWVQREYYEIDDKMPVGYHADKSVILLQSFMKLKLEEIEAIRAHMGGFDECVKGNSRLISDIFSKNELAVLLHCADLRASYIREKKR